MLTYININVNIEASRLMMTVCDNLGLLMGVAICCKIL